MIREARRARCRESVRGAREDVRWLKSVAVTRRVLLRYDIFADITHMRRREESESARKDEAALKSCCASKIWLAREMREEASEEATPDMRRMPRLDMR